MTKNTNKAEQRITIRYGYGLFALLLAGVTLSTIMPMSQLLWRPEVKHYNVMVLLISLVAGAVLPLLISYLVGDKATRVKDKTLHHFNGVLFGLLAYWLSHLFSALGPYIIMPIREAMPGVASAAVMNAWPIVATVVIVAVISYLYYRSRRKESVLLYRPYVITCWIAAIAANALSPLVQLLDTNRLHWMTLAWIAGLVVVATLSYLVYRKSRLARREKAARTLIATTVGFIAFYVVNQLLPYPAEPGSTILLLSVFACGASLIVWTSYLVLTSRTIR